MKIKKLKLYSSNLKGQEEFYVGILGFDLINSSDEELIVRIGISELVFSNRIKNDHKKPYHFAFNIPSNQSNEAHDWLGKRTDLLEYDGNTVHYFEHWDANAIYFKDADGNIGELIARNTLSYRSNAAFSISSVLCISEIGLAHLDLEGLLRLFKKKFGLSLYSGNPQRFMSVGNEEGLFICVNPIEKQYWFPTEDKIYSKPFSIDFEIDGSLYQYSL